MSRAAQAFENWTHVASFRSTRKGETCVTAKGTPMGGDGKDGRHFYKIEKKEVGEWRCSCPDHTYRGSKTGRPCKHMLALFSAAKIVIARGELKTTDIIIYEPRAF